MVSQRLVLAGGNNITLSQSVDALSLSATVTISGGNSFSAGVSSGGSTSGATGLVSQQLVLAGGNNVTLSQSVNGGSATVTISAGTGGAGAVPTLSIWQNAVTSLSVVSFPANSFNLVPLDPKNDVFPGNMTVSTVYLDVSIPTNSTSRMSQANSGTIKFGIYTRNASTLSILNSVAYTWALAAAANNSQALVGRRWITFHSSLWSVSPPTFSNTDYYLGYIMHTSGTPIGINILAYNYLATGQRSGTVGVSITSGNTSMGWSPFVGASVSSLANTAALPTSIQLGELSKAGSEAGIIPHLVFENISSNF